MRQGLLMMNEHSFFIKKIKATYSFVLNWAYSSDIVSPLSWVWRDLSDSQVPNAFLYAFPKKTWVQSGLSLARRICFCLEVYASTWCQSGATRYQPCGTSTRFWLMIPGFLNEEIGRFEGGSCQVLVLHLHSRNLIRQRVQKSAKNFGVIIAKQSSA